MLYNPFDYKTYMIHKFEIYIAICGTRIIMTRLLKEAYKKKQRTDKNYGFSLVELIVVIAIMAVLIAVLTPMYTSHMHKVKVAADWANLKSYYVDILADFVLTGEYNSLVQTDIDKPETWHQTEIHYLDGHTVQMKAGYFAVTREANGNGYHLSYYCDECLKDWDKHSKTCILTLAP